METGTPAWGEDAPDPKVAALRKEIEEWGTKTTIGVLAGMLYGGSKEAFDSSKDANLLLPTQAESKDLNQRRKILKDMMEKRVLRIASGTVLGGAKLGAFTAIFCGVQHGLAIRRNAHDTMNVVAAGAVTAAAFGLACFGV